MVLNSVYVQGNLWGFAATCFPCCQQPQLPRRIIIIKHPVINVSNSSLLSISLFQNSALVRFEYRSAVQFVLDQVSR